MAVRAVLQDGDGFVGSGFVRFYAIPSVLHEDNLVGEWLSSLLAPAMKDNNEVICLFFSIAWLKKGYAVMLSDFPAVKPF